MSEKAIIKSLSPDLATIRLTRTMLQKHIIDANESVRRLALLCGIDYQQIGAGEKITRAATIADGTDTAINFYKTKRGDKRVSISRLNAHARAGDLVGITYVSAFHTFANEFSGITFMPTENVFLIINITATAERRNEVA